LLNLMGDETKRKELSDKGRGWAKQFSWENVASSWADEFDVRDRRTRITVYTPTIRRGWWNIMGNNLAKQTYRNFEWVIIDDYPKDRSDIAKEYAKKYSLDIQYFRGKERKIQRTYGLCNANNTVMEKATGEVLVFLQDFILIPDDALEQIAVMYKKNPDCLQALPDMYFAPKIKPDKEKEDWFNGETDIIGKFIRKNIRLQNQGLRFTDNPMDFEQNYGAVPLKIVKELGGWHEFYDESLGFDNTDMAYRCLKAGYKILIDETNIAVCLNIWPTLAGTQENGGIDRSRRLNDPRYHWMIDMINQNRLPLKRTQQIDDLIDLQYTIPKEIKDIDAVKWMKENLEKIIAPWLKKYEKGFIFNKI
jgi:glycosyltransferase involved in cell wall biosynthesis